MIDRYVKADYAGRRVNAVQIKLKEIEADKAVARKQEGWLSRREIPGQEVRKD